MDEKRPNVCGKLTDQVKFEMINSIPKGKRKHKVGQLQKVAPLRFGAD
jgi:hypothetical protein